jgi:ABC-2 type transport system permease protein
MDRALWLLLRLRLLGWLRRLRRALGTVRGILLCVFGLLMCGIWLLPAILFTPPPGPGHLAEVRRLGPLAVMAFCVLNVIFSSGERAISFSPAEVNLLFPAPFSRRQLLLYKMAGMLGGTLLSAVFLTLVTRQHTASFLAGLVGLSLTLAFLQLFSMVLALLGSAVGARAYNRRRRVVLVVLVTVLLAAAVQAGVHFQGRSLGDVLTEVEQTPVVQALLTPVGWLIRAGTAERIWPDLVQWAALGLVLDLCLVALVLALDANYLETAAAASEKLYARLQRLRRGGPALGTPASGTARLGLPSLPRWGGVGPLLWRQLTTALRSLWSLLLVLVLFAVITAPILLNLTRHGPDPEPAATLVGLLVGISLFVPPLLPFDFRGDLDRMDLLKTLPLPAWRLVVGELLAPALLTSLAQLLFLAGAQILLGRVQPALLGAMIFLAPINLLLFGVENLFFLWFPTRLVGAGPGDFQLFGRQMLLWLGKLLVLGVAVGLAFVTGLLVFLLAGHSWLAAGLAAWLVMAGITTGLLPLVVLAFQHFDVAQDTPP